MRFLLDENLSYRFAKALNALKREVFHSTDRFKAGTSDSEILAGLGGHGWALVTQDKRILDRPHERLVLQEKKVTTFFLGPFFSEMQFWDQGVWLISHWTRLEGLAEGIEPGTCFLALKTGKMKALPPIRLKS